MTRSCTHPRGRRAAALAAFAAAVVSTLLAVPATAAPSDEPSPDPSTTATTAASTSTVPSTTVAPSTSAAPTSQPGPDSTSTTLPGDTTTITTLPPDATLPPSQTGGARWIQPVIPSASADPVFHAARQVDAATVDAEKADESVRTGLVRVRAAEDRRIHADSVLASARRDQQEAVREVAEATAGARNAAVRAYAGFGSDRAATASDAVVDGPGDPEVISKAYMTVTAGEARQRLAEGKRRKAAADRRVATAEADASTAATAARDARDALENARTTAAEAHRRLIAVRQSLVDVLADAPGFGPGALELLPQLVAAGAKTVPSPAGTIVLPPDTDPRTAYALAFVVAQIGKPYVWGATGPGTYDCSGLMLRAWASVGVQIPRVSQAQQASVTPVAPADARPGDLVFFGMPAYHVGMYIGGGLMIDAPFTGALVRVDRVWSSVTGFGRVLPTVAPPAPPAPPA